MGELTGRYNVPVLSAVVLVHHPYYFVRNRPRSMPLLDYSNAVLLGVNKSTLARLQLVKNAATRFLTRTDRRQHITPVLKSLHWLPITFRVQLPVLLLFRYDSTSSYQHVSSERLGWSELYQEQYVFIYRTETVTVTDLYQYPDDLKGDEDAFSREPFVVRFKAPRTVIKEFVLIPQHTTPTNTTKELDALYDVLQRVKKMWRTENVMLLGDFNADCGYLAKKNRKNVRLITDKNLYWLIAEDSNTTVQLSTSCSCDRYDLLTTLSTRPNCKH
nr:deoxyribonuclease gamma-like [Nothobranchius furzeri]